MAFDRSAAKIRMNNLSPAAAALCSPAITATDDAANWGPAIDNTFLLMGVAYADLTNTGVCVAPSGKERDGLEIAKMYGLELLCEKLAGDVANNVNKDAVTEARSNVLAQLRSQWADQVNRVETMGYTVERQSTKYGDWSLDVYEPNDGQG